MHIYLNIAKNKRKRKTREKERKQKKEEKVKKRKKFLLRDSSQRPSVTFGSQVQSPHDLTKQTLNVSCINIRLKPIA